MSSKDTIKNTKNSKPINLPKEKPISTRVVPHDEFFEKNKEPSLQEADFIYTLADLPTQEKRNLARELRKLYSAFRAFYSIFDEASKSKKPMLSNQYWIMVGTGILLEPHLASLEATINEIETNIQR